jgi:hypothetical protein
MKSATLFFVLIAIFFIKTTNSQAEPLLAAPHHPFDRVEIVYPNNECSFMYSPVDFCDERHVSEIKKAIKNGVENFNGHYILLKIKEWRPSEYYGDSVVVIDTQTGIAYPMPFDYYSGAISVKNSKTIKKKKAKIIFSAGSNKICIDGSILVYRATENGNFCFSFQNDRFIGYHTEYMGSAELGN